MSTCVTIAATLALTSTMSVSTWLTLIVPGIGAALAQSAEAGSTGATQLARIAGRGSINCTWNRRDAQDSGLRPWQRGLLATLELPAAQFASASVSARGSEAANAGGYWMHVEPVHFAAGLDRLTFMPLEGEARILDTERTSIAAVLAGHLQSCGMEFHTLTDGSWCVRSAQAFDVTTSSPEAAASHELDLMMPRGPDAGALRRLMTELQMLLHDHPVNDARARRGLPAINAVWLWGTTVMIEPNPLSHLPLSLPFPLPLAFADAPYLRGIYALHSQPVAPMPESCDVLMSNIAAAKRAVAVVPITDLPALEDQWIAPLAGALASRRLARLDFILDGWHLQVDRAALRRFWRKALPPAEWVA